MLLRGFPRLKAELHMFQTGGSMSDNMRNSSCHRGKAGRVLGEKERYWLCAIMDQLLALSSRRTVISLCMDTVLGWWRSTATWPKPSEDCGISLPNQNKTTSIRTSQFFVGRMTNGSRRSVL